MITNKLKIKQEIQIPLTYLILGLLWIMLSDELLFYFTNSDNFSIKFIHQFNSYKGYFFITITSILLYLLLKNTNRKLIQTKNDFKNLFIKNPNPMWIYDQEEYRILMVNQVACNRYDYSFEEFTQLSIFDIRPSSEVAKLKQHLRLDNDKNEVYSDSDIWLHQDRTGNEFYVHIYSHPIIYQGKKCRIVASINVHKQILAENEIKNILKALNSAALVTITDLSGIITFANDQFCKKIGYTFGEIIGQDHRIISSQFHTKEFWEEMWATIASGDTWRQDIRNKSKNGSYYWLDTIICPVLDNKEKITKYISISYEITERKKLECDQQQLLDDLAEYAFLTSHHLRAPLARILGLAQLFDQFEEQEEIIGYLINSSHELDTVIREMNETLRRKSHDLIIEKRKEKSE